MRTVCITTRRNEAQRLAHFAGHGVHADLFHAFHGEKLGLRTVNAYEVDAPGSGFNMGPKPTAIWISHRALWAALLLLPEDEILILEEDARFADDWRERFDRALAHVPADWDVLFLGACCTKGRPTRHIADQVYEVQWPMCLQAYCVRKKALMTMIETQDAATCYGPVDITLTFHTFPKLRVYTVLPRIVEQFDTEIPL